MIFSADVALTKDLFDTLYQVGKMSFPTVLEVSRNGGNAMKQRQVALAKMRCGSLSFYRTVKVRANCVGADAARGAAEGGLREENTEYYVVLYGCCSVCAAAVCCLLVAAFSQLARGI